MFKEGTSGPAPAGFASDSLRRCSTTSQPLTWQVIEEEPEYWGDWLQSQLENELDMPAEEAMWRLFVEIAARGADLLTTVFEGAGYRWGQIYYQMDPPT